MTEQQINKLEAETKADIKSIYKNITILKEAVAGIRPNLNILFESVKQVNEYTHERIHYLLNTDKGVELKLKELATKISTLETFKKTQVETALTWRFKIVDFTFKILFGGFFIFIGHFIK